MSRNLGDTSCKICYRDVVLCGEPHSITPDEAGRYFDEYQGMAVADAVCPRCDAKYLAWCVAPPSKRGGHFDNRDGRPFFDLSFRRAFNDEPAPEDLPTTLMLQRVHLEQVQSEIAQMMEKTRILLHEMSTAIEGALVRPPYWEAYRR